MNTLLPFIITSNILASDSFNRADNANSLSSSDTGQLWTIGVGTWGINNNKAYTSIGTSASVAFVETLYKDVIVSSKITYGANEGVIFRVTDGSNYIMARIGTVDFAVIRSINGTVTTLGSYAFTPSIGTIYEIRVVCKGTSIRAFLDGEEKIQVTETFNQNATKCGLRESNSTVGRFDDFYVEGL